MSTLRYSFPQYSGSNNTIIKKKRRPAGTPDPDAEVVSFSPRTLLESDRYVCDICNQGFQRDQNLQMHRRRHKVPWKLLKREPSTASSAGETRKRVFVCPEPSCLHHDPRHALGDLVGIKKHYRRKHSDRKQWVCEKCRKGYAVQSDYKAHLKTCGTRGHTCDCGKVFSRVESFIEHQDTCNANRSRVEAKLPQTLAMSQSASSLSPSGDTNFSSAAATTAAWSSFLIKPNLELQLLPPSTPRSTITTTIAANTRIPSALDEPCIAQLSLSLGPSVGADDQAEKAMAEEARLEARRQVELAEQEYANAKRIRLQAQAELDKAFVLREHAAKSINSMIVQITCQSCKVRMWPKAVAGDEKSIAALTVTDGEPK